MTYWADSLESALAYTQEGVGHGGVLVVSARVDPENVLYVDTPQDVAKAIAPLLAWSGPRRVVLKSSQDEDEPLEDVDPEELLEALPNYDRPYQLWEEHAVVLRALQEGWDWVTYEDDYPEGCITWLSLKGLVPGTLVDLEEVESEE